MSITTTTKLLDALRDPRQEAVWREFDDRYRPIVFGVAKRMGLDEESAEEVAQRTLVEFVRDYAAGKYDRSRGRLRAWIVGIARHRALDIRRSQVRRRHAGGDTVLARLPDEASWSAIWDAEQERVLFERAWIHLRDSTKTDKRTLEAFELHVFQRQPASAVAEAMECTVAEVYRIKHRLTKHLRTLVADLSAAYE